MKAMGTWKMRIWMRVSSLMELKVMMTKQRMQLQPPQALAFEIDPDIDINSQALIDMVSTNPNVVEAVPQLFTPAMAPETFTVDPNWDW
jgi:hypothetical protein